MSEIEMWDAKFDMYAAEKNPISDILLVVKKSTANTGGPRSNSVGK